MRRRSRLLDGATSWEAFERDACFLLENVFYANGEGIDVSPDIVEVLQEAQPNCVPSVIDSYKVFGVRKDGSADGRTGSWLELDSTLSTRLLAIITKRAAELRPNQRPLVSLRAQPGCDCRMRETDHETDHESDGDTVEAAQSD